MKATIMILLSLIFLFSCGNSGWSSNAGKEYAYEFIKTCSKPLSAYNGGKKYCECVLDKLKSKYTGPLDNVEGQMNDVQNNEWVRECLSLMY